MTTKKFSVTITCEQQTIRILSASGGNCARPSLKAGLLNERENEMGRIYVSLNCGQQTANS